MQNDPFLVGATIQQDDPFLTNATPETNDPFAATASFQPQAAPFTSMTQRALAKQNVPGTFLGDIGLTAKAIGTGVYSAAFDVFPKILAEAIRGGDIDVNDADTALDRWIKEQKKDLERWDMPEHQKNRKLFGIIKAQDLQAGIQNLGYSAAIGTAGMLPGAKIGAAIGAKIGGGAGLAAGGVGALPGAGIGATIGGVVGGMIGSAATTAPISYRATKDQFLSDMLDRALEQNPSLTQEQWAEMKAALESDAQAYAFWEAAPETVGNMLTAGIIKTPVGTYIKNIPNIKNAIARVLTKAGVKLALDVPEELATETLTGVKQGAIEAKVGIRDEAPTVSETFMEILPQTLVTTVAGMGMGSAANRISSIRQERTFYQTLDKAGYKPEEIKRLASTIGFDDSALRMATERKPMLQEAIEKNVPPSVMADMRDSFTPSLLMTTYAEASEQGANESAGVRAVDDLIASQTYKTLQQQMREMMFAKRESNPDEQKLAEPTAAAEPAAAPTPTVTPTAAPAPTTAETFAPEPTAPIMPASEPATAIPTTQAAPSQPSAIYQAAPLATKKQTQGQQIAIHAIDQNIFEKMIRPMIGTNIQTLDTYRREFPTHTHVMLERTAPNERWKLTGVGSEQSLKRKPESYPSVFRQIDSAEAENVMRMPAKPVAGVFIPDEPGVRFEGTQNEILEKLTGNRPEITPAAFTDSTDANATYLAYPETEVQERVKLGVVSTRTAKGGYNERIFAWDTDKWHRLPEIRDAKFSTAAKKVIARKFVSGAYDGVTHPNAVLKSTVNPRTEIDEVGLTMKEAPKANGLPAALADPTKAIPETVITGKDKQKIWWKSINKWITALPLFQGHKRDMAGPVIKSAINPITGWTNDEANRIKTIYEPFGGGGSWGLFLATTTFRNANRLVIGEKDPARLQMIAYMHQNGDKFSTDLRAKDETGRSAWDILDMLWNEGYGIQSGGDALGGRIEPVVRSKTYDKQTVPDNQIALLKIVQDLMPRRTIPMDDGVANVTDQVRRLNMMVKDFVKNGGRIEYQSGDAYDPNRPIEQGNTVLSILDPPYVFTTGYGEDLVSVDTYEQTANLIDRIVNAGNNIIYTDSAWWIIDKKPIAAGMSSVERKTMEQQYRKEQDMRKRVAPAEKERAAAILETIQDKLNRFQVVEQRIGQHRYEVLGMHNAMPRTTEQAQTIEQPQPKAKVMTKEEWAAKVAEKIASLPYKVKQSIWYKKRTKFYKTVIRDIEVNPDMTVTLLVDDEKGRPTKYISEDIISLTLTGAQKSAITRARRAAEISEYPKDQQQQIKADAKAFDEVIQGTAPDYYDPYQQDEYGISKTVATAWERIAREIDPANKEYRDADMTSFVDKARMLPVLLAWTEANKENLFYLPETMPTPQWKAGAEMAAETAPEVRMSLEQQELFTPSAPTQITTPEGAGLTPITKPDVETGLSSQQINQIVDENIQRASDIAQRYNIPDATDEEKFSAAREALVRAANKWNPAKGFDFGAFANIVIRNEMDNLFNQKIRKAQYSVSSMDASIGRRQATGEAVDSTMANLIPDWRDLTPDEQAARKDVFNAMQNAVAEMRPADQTIIDGIGNDRPMQDIARELGVTPAAVSIRKAKILKELRAKLEAQGVDNTLLTELFTPRAPEVLMSQVNKAAPTAGNVTAAQASSRIANWISKQSALPKVRVFQNIEEAAGLGLSDATMSMLRNERPRGFFFERANEIVVIADGLDNADRALEVVLHEAIGHYGVAHILGKDFNSAMAKLSREISDTELTRIAKDYYNALPDQGLDNPLDSEANRAYLMAEYVAVNAQQQPTLWKQFIEIVRRLLAKIMPATYVNKLVKQGEIDRLLQASREYVRTGERAPIDDYLKADTRMSKAPSTTPERDARFRELTKTWTPSTDPAAWETWKAAHPDEYGALLTEGTDYRLFYHAKTKGDFKGGKMSADIGSDADIMGRGLYIAAERDYVAATYGEPIALPIRAKFASTQQWVKLGQKYSHLSVFKQREASRRELMAKGYDGVLQETKRGRIGMVWNQSVLDEAQRRIAEVAPDSTGRIPPPSEWGDPTTPDIRMSKAPSEPRANPVIIDEATRNRYFQIGRSYQADFVPRTEMVARVQPQIEQEVSQKGGMQRVLIDASINGFPTTDAGTVKAQLLLNTPEYAALFNGTDIEQDLAISLTTRSLQQGTIAGRTLAYRHDLLQTPAQRQAAVLKLLSSPPQSVFSKWDAMTEMQRNMALAEHRARMKLAIKAMKALGINDITEIPQEILNDQQRFMEIISQVSQQYSTTGDRVYEYWRNSILSGLHTNIVNVTSNMVHAGWEMFVQKPAEALVNMFVQNPNAPTFASVAASWRKIWPHVHNANAAMVKSFQTETGMFSAIDTQGQTAIPGKLGRIIRTPQRGLLAMDEWFKTMLTQSLAYDYATRIADQNNLSGTDRDNFIEWAATNNDGDSVAYEQAQKEATRILFQERPGAIGSSLLAARNAKGFTGWAFKYLVPFITTPTNLIKIGIAKSPFGILRLGMEGIAALRGKESRYAGESGKAKFITDAVEQTIAWGVAGILYSFTAPPDDDEWPILTGTISGSPNEKRFRMLNIPPQSIRIGNRWYSYARLEPFSNALTLTVDALTALHNVKAGRGLTTDDMSKVLSLVKDKTYLQTIGDLMRGIENPEEWVALSQNFSSSWVPNLLKQAIRATDPIQRDNRVREKGLAFLGKSLAVRGLQRALPVSAIQPIPRIDHWGRPISSDVGMKMLGQPTSDIAWRITVPSRVQKVRDETNIDRMIWNWNRAQTDDAKQWWPGNVRPTIKFAGREFEMSDSQFEQYQILRGQTALKMAQRINWNFDAPTQHHMKVLQAVFERSGKIARTKMLRDIIAEQRLSRINKG